MKPRAWVLAVIAPCLLAAEPTPISRIVAGESASAVLDGWCRAHGLPSLVARQVSRDDKPAGADVRTVLDVSADEPLRHRRVLLGCRVALSAADNWYLPRRLDGSMNHALETTDRPFGLVVRPLAFKRRTLSAGVKPDGVFEVRAILVDATRTPFSYVVEDYEPRLSPRR